MPIFIPFLYLALCVVWSLCRRRQDERRFAKLPKLRLEVSCGDYHLTASRSIHAHTQRLVRCPLCDRSTAVADNPAGARRHLMI
jgi:hypothetical protein